MAPPCYARPTLSSASKSVHKTAEPQKKPKKLKRPSAIPARSSQLQLLNIKPRVPTKPCPLATLPVELRLLIYEYALYNPSTCRRRYRSHFGKGLWPALLRVSQAVRQEAAYVFYTSTHFTCYIYYPDFSPVKSWIKRLPASHRSFLSRNRHLYLEFQWPHYQIREALSFSGRSLVHRWEECSRFGNLYSLADAHHKAHFVHFCSLADWLLWCGKPVYEDIQWKYRFATGGRWWRSREDDELEEFMKSRFRVLALPCVEKEWVRERHKGRMKREALNMLEHLDKAYPRVGTRGDRIREWDAKVRAMRRYLESW